MRPWPFHCVSGERDRYTWHDTRGSHADAAPVRRSPQHHGVLRLRPKRSGVDSEQRRTTPQPGLPRSSRSEKTIKHRSSESLHQLLNFDRVYCTTMADLSHGHCTMVADLSHGQCATAADPSHGIVQRQPIRPIGIVQQWLIRPVYIWSFFNPDQTSPPQGHDYFSIFIVHTQASIEHWFHFFFCRILIFRFFFDIFIWPHFA